MRLLYISWVTQWLLSFLISHFHSALLSLPSPPLSVMPLLRPGLRDLGNPNSTMQTNSNEASTSADGPVMRMLPAEPDPVDFATRTFKRSLCQTCDRAMWIVAERLDRCHVENIDKLRSILSDRRRAVMDAIHAKIVHDARAVIQDSKWADVVSSTASDPDRARILSEHSSAMASRIEQQMEAQLRAPSGPLAEIMNAEAQNILDDASRLLGRAEAMIAWWNLMRDSARQDSPPAGA